MVWLAGWLAGRCNICVMLGRDLFVSLSLPHRDAVLYRGLGLDWLLRVAMSWER